MRTSSRWTASLVTAVMAAVTVAVVVMSASPALADGAVVARNDGGGGEFAPPTVTIAAGEQVVWTFENGGHSVRSTDGAGFDSHPDCADRPLVGVSQCASGGEQYSFTFADPGTYNYNCRIHGGAMAGTVVVVAPTPTEEPTPEPTRPEPTTDPTTEPTPEPTSEPTADPTAEPTTEPTEDPSVEPTEDPNESASPSPTPLPSVDPVPTVSPSPTATEIPSPTFEPFPPPRELPTPTPSPSEDLGAVALGDDGPSGTGRILSGVVAGAMLFATAGAFGKLVLFGEPWIR